jgi:hypothetical protein
MLKGKGHVLAVIVAVAAGGWLAVGCSAHVSIGETPAVSRHDVETEVATTLARQQNQPVPKVVCPGDLKGKVGTVMYCSLAAQGSDTTYPVRCCRSFRVSVAASSLVSAGDGRRPRAA